MTHANPADRRSWGGSATLTTAAILSAVVLLLPLVLIWLPGSAAFPVSGQECPIAWKSLVASVGVAVAAAVLAVAVGSILAAALVLTDIPGRSLWAVLLLLPFLCPRAVWALGQLYCFGGGGLMERWGGDGSRVLVGVSDNTHYLATALVLAEIHCAAGHVARWPRAGSIAARRLRLRPTPAVPVGSARWIAGAVRQEMAAAFLLTFALSLGEFAVPHILQCPLYPMEIYVAS